MIPDDLDFATLALLTEHAPIHPSDVATYRRCPRKLAFRRIDGVQRDEDDPSYVVEGRYGHALIERHYLSPAQCSPIQKSDFPGADRSRIDTVFAQLVDHLPAGYAPRIERKLKVQHPSGIWFEGTPDFLDVDPETFDVLICDWKFRDNIRPGTASDREIEVDPQAIVYSWFALHSAHRGAIAECNWYWINKPDKKTPTKARKNSHIITKAKFDSESIGEVMAEHVLPTARAMVLDRLLYDRATQVPATPEIGCAYGKGYGMQNCSYSLPCDYFDPGISRADRAAQLKLI